MIYTLMFGAPISSGDHQFGTLNRIIVNNGVANQFTVNVSGLFSGPDRVVPISDVVEATEQGITLRVSEDEWKAYNAFNIEQIITADPDTAPAAGEPAPPVDLSLEPLGPRTPEVGVTDRSVSNMSVVVTNKTQVGNLGSLAGMVVDTGIPQRLLLDSGQFVPFEQVGVVDEGHITLGPVAGRLDGATAIEDGRPLPDRMDGATPPGTIGQERRHDR